MFVLFGPLTQFDLVMRASTCFYDLSFLVGGKTILTLALSFLLVLPLVWQIYEYYASDLHYAPVVYFDDEAIVIDLVTNENYNYSDLISLLFAIIFTANVSGLVPYTQTVTSQIIFTLILSSLVMYTVWFQAFYFNKILMLNHFLPNGAPLVITPFIILIELISNLSRVVSLSVRLFANMTSGHALLKILASFSLGACLVASGWAGLMILPTTVIFIITILEFLIAFLQTYVFVTLVLIYVSEQS